MTLQIDDLQRPLTVEQTLTGWRREFCVELLGEGHARIFLREVETSSLKATELRRAILFHRVGSVFADLNGCVAAAHQPLEQLAQTAIRQQPNQDNLFVTLSYDRGAWESVVNAVETWERRQHAASR